MNWIEALILGIVQGLTEFLPISSSGHLALANHFMDTKLGAEEALSYTVLLHLATCMSTILALRKGLLEILKPLEKRRLFTEKNMLAKIVLSMIPAGIIGLFFEDELSYFFSGHIGYTIAFLFVTGVLLLLSDLKTENRKGLKIGPVFLMGIAQAFALLPGISRSGATIAFGVLSGVKKELATQFSFIMVLPLIFGKIILDILSGEFSIGKIDLTVSLIGFAAAFVSGFLACKFMLVVVRKGQLKYFSFYCFFVVLAYLFHSWFL